MKNMDAWLVRSLTVLGASLCLASASGAQTDPCSGSAIASKWTLAVWTGKVANAGTDADVWLNIEWEGGHLPPKIVPDQPGNDNERGNWTVYDFTLDDAIPLHLKRVELTHSNTGNRPGWFVHQVVLMAHPDGAGRYVVINQLLDRWLASDEPDGLVANLNVKPEPVGIGNYKDPTKLPPEVETDPPLPATAEFGNMGKADGLGPAIKFKRALDHK